MLSDQIMYGLWYVEYLFHLKMVGG